jgi:hypothetical protein
MRKRLFTPTPLGIRFHDEDWLDVDRAASVEVTSEEKDSLEQGKWKNLARNIATVLHQFNAMFQSRFEAAA